MNTFNGVRLFEEKEHVTLAQNEQYYVRLKVFLDGFNPTLYCPDSQIT